MSSWEDMGVFLVKKNYLIHLFSLIPKFAFHLAVSFGGQKLFSWISSLLSIFALLSVLCLHSQLLFGKVVKNIQ